MKNNNLVVIDPKAVALGFAVAVVAAFFALASGLSTPAHADGGDGGTGGGSGSCSYSGSVVFTTGLGGVPNSGNSCYNTGNMQADLNRVGASGCWNNRSELVAVWTFRVNGQWATYPNDASGTRAAAFRDAISRAPVSPKAKQIANNYVKSTNNVIVCVWQSQLGPETVSAERPTTSDGTCARPNGRIYIPNDGNGDKTYYERGDGTNLNKGQWYDTDGNGWTVRQKVRNPDRYRFGDGSATKSWTINPRNVDPDECTAGAPPAPRYTPYTVRGCDNDTYNSGGGSFTIPSSGIATYRVNGAERPAGTYSLGAGGSVSITAHATDKPLAGRTSWSFSGTSPEALPSCATSNSYNEWEDRDLSRTVCTNGTTTTYENTQTNSAPYPYNWRTEISDGLAPGVRPVGTVAFIAQSADKLSPLGQLLASNPNPTDAQINSAVLASNSAGHATIANLNANNVKALSQGGVMNVIERTTNVVIVKTITNQVDTPYTSCTIFYQPQERVRTVTEGRAANPLTYTVYQRNVTRIPAQAAYWSWESRTRTREQRQVRQYEGTVCGQAEIPNRADWQERTDNKCGANNGKWRFRWGIHVMEWGPWTNWSAWERKTNSDACAEENGSAGGFEREVRNCKKHPYEPPRDQVGGESLWSGASSYCPGGVDFRCVPHGITYSDTVIYGPWSAWYNNGPEYRGATTVTNGTPTYTQVGNVNAAAAQTPQMTAMWQSLANHCNAAGYSTASSGYTKLSTTVDPSAVYSGSAVTAKISGNNPAWGAGAVSPKGTNVTGFYDKQCSFQGRLMENGDTTQERVFFRDNELREVTVPQYRPANVGPVADTGMDAMATILTRWTYGTPNVNGYSSEGALRSYAGEDQLFSSSNTPAPNLKNWMTYNDSNGLSWALLADQENQFSMGGNWASDSGMPNVFTTKWIFAPNVANRIPTANIGFGGASGAQSYTDTTQSTAVHGQVYGVAKKGVGTSPAYSTLVAQNTGTGTTNNLDNDVDRIWGDAPGSAAPWSDDPTANQFYNVIRLVRSVGS